MAQWIELRRIEDIKDVIHASHESKQMIYKHSTRCNISQDAYEELQKGDYNLYYLDLLAYRSVSDEIANIFNVVHRSPQVLIIDKGECVYHESHWRIHNDEIKSVLEN